MKTSLNLINALNESFEKEIEEKVAKHQAEVEATKKSAKNLKESIEVDKDGNKSIRDDKTGRLKRIQVSRKTQDKMADEYNKKQKLNETGEWDDNDEEMIAWKEDIREKANQLALNVDGELKSVHGFDKYQGPYAIVHTPKHGDVEVWFGEDSGYYNVKVAHVGWITGGLGDISNWLNMDNIPVEFIVTESEKAAIENKINRLEDKMKKTPIKDLTGEEAKEIEKLEKKLKNKTLTEETKEPKEKSTIQVIKDKLAKIKAEEDAKYEEIKTRPDGTLKEDEVIEITQTEPDIDYVITDVTELEEVTDGDVQAPDIDSILTMLGESFKEDYGDAIKINILSANLLENGSFALVDISTPQILKEFEEKHIYDAAVGKNLVLENDGEYYTFKVNSLNGTTRYSKRTKNPIETIREWVETEFLSEAKKEKEEKLAFMKAKTEKETVESYINARPELKQEKANIEMFIELSKGLDNKEEMRSAIQNRMYGFAAEFPNNIEVTNKDDKYELKFNKLDDIVEIIFGKEWVIKSEEELPGNDVKGLKESYDQFNIGNIDVVYNPQTQECLYSIDSADIHDKKINLSKVPSVEVPYDTDTIIKDHIEKRYGPIPQEVENNKEEPEGEALPPLPAEDAAIEVTDTEVVEEADEVPTPADMGIDSQPAEDEVSEENTAETGSAYFVKIRPGKAKAGIEDIRQQQKDGVVQQKSSYIVVEEVNLSEADFNEFVSDFSQPRDFLANVQPLDRKNYAFNVVKVMAEGVPYVVLVDPTGFNYARYVAIVDEV